MAAKHLAGRHPMAKVVRDQMQQTEFRQALNSAYPVVKGNKIPKRLRDLLDELEVAEARKDKRSRP